jgi:hypothetical protein
MVFFFARRIGACFAHTGAALGRTVEDVFRRKIAGFGCG